MMSAVDQTSEVSVEKTAGKPASARIMESLPQCGN